MRNALTREPQALHRSFIRPNGSGKADVDPPRASVGPAAGGVVMLGARADDRPLLRGEGIETAASAAALIGGTPWAAISAGNLARLALPPSARDIVIAADHDPAGEVAAWAAATRGRSEGRTVRVAFPDRPGTDFSDQVRSARDA